MRGGFTALLLVFTHTVRLCAAEGSQLAGSAIGQNGTACDALRLLPSGVDRCRFVTENCPTESLIPYLELFYCHAKPAGLSATSGMLLCCLAVLVLIFRLLQSTAEGFFSPVLTQISQEMGLPPRFAGVTLLALGNGAPDLVAAVAFVRAGKYRVALSGLLGGGMFVGAAVAGLVIMAADGVKARGALLRDVSCYLIAVGTVGLVLASGSVTWATAVALLLMYLLFVAVVLAADIHHIWQSSFRSHGGAEKPADQQPLLAGDVLHPPEADLPSGQPSVASATSIELTEGLQGLRPSSETTEGISLTQSGSAGQDSGWSGSQRQLTYNEKVHMSGEAYRQMALAELARSDTFFGHPGMEHARRLALLEEDTDEPAAAEAGYAPPQPEEAGRWQGTASGGQPDPAVAGPGSSEAVADPQTRVLEWQQSHAHEAGHGRSAAQTAREPAGHSGQTGGQTQWQGPGRQRASPGGGAWQAAHPVAGRAVVAWRRVCKAGSWLGVFFDIAEYPFLLLRRATIPLVDNDSYDRTWFVAACVGAPVAVLWYLGQLTVAFTLPLALGLGSAVAACAYVFSVLDKPPEWSLGLPFPVGAAAVAAAGFVISAMWIDTIAGELVALLDFLGTLFGIPHEVLGLTVLAWGNSVGDLSTNLTMARRGLSNMAMTACFAGPIFNILVALGVGFMQYLSATGLSSTTVRLEAVDFPSFILIFVNGLLLIAVGIVHNQWVPAWYGAVPLVLYVLYMAVCLAVAFG